MSTAWYRLENNELTIRLQVQPGCREDRIEGLHAGRLKVRIKAQPVENRANIYLKKFFAGEFGVPKTRIEITRGLNSKLKTIVIKKPGPYPGWFEKDKG